VPQLFRVTFIYRQGDVGWTDTIFNTAGGITALMNNARALITPLMDLRVNATVLEAIRMSDDLVFRDSNFLPLTPVSGVPGNYPLATNVRPAEPENSVDLRLETPVDNVGIVLSLHRRIFPLRGLASEVFNGPIFEPNPGFNSRLTNLQLALANPDNGWALKVRSIVAPFVPFSGIAADGTVSARTVSFDPTWAGKYLTFHRLRGVAPPAVRPFLIVSVDTTIIPNTLLLRGWNRGPVLIGAIGGAFSQVITFGLQAVAQTIVDGVGRHKVGRPFDLRRGRRSPAR
jgi:hypothetical protein